jgi:mono/diheme cytochrome c family protein
MRSRFAWFLLGMGAAAAGLLVLGAALILPGAQGFSARERPTAIEASMARALRTAALPSSARKLGNPVPKNGETLKAGMEHWADHCAMCHGNDGSGDTPMGRHTYPPAPDMRLPATQNLLDGELFYIIQNGIRLSAMPAWGAGGEHDQEDSWKLVHFIRHLPQLTEAEKAEMEQLNPKSPAESKEQEEEESFLKGEDSHAKGEDSHAQKTEHRHQ